MAKEKSHVRLQKQMRKYHSFLYGLFLEKRGWKNRISLKKTNNAVIFLVLRLLFCISVGHIPMRYKTFQQIVKSKKRQLLGSLKFTFRKLRQASSQEKRTFVLKFSSIYHVLFEPLFVRPVRKEAK